MTPRHPALRSSLCTLFATAGLALPSLSAAQSWEVGYDASLGTLPSDQGWMMVTSDPMPSDGLDAGNYLVAGGALVQGGTGGINSDEANSQWHHREVSTFDLDDELMVVDLRLQILDSTGNPPGQTPYGEVAGGGFHVWIVDEEGSSVQLQFGNDHIMLLDGGLPSSSDWSSFDPQVGFADYQIRTSPDQITVFVNGVMRLTQERSDVPRSGFTRNAIAFGDLSDAEWSSSQLEFIRLSRYAVPAASVRDYTVVSETLSSTSATTFSNTVSCPAGTFVLSGGVETSGADGFLAVAQSHPVGGSPPTGWRGKAREIVSTAADWQMTVEVICGEVPGYRHVTLPPVAPSTAPVQSAVATCDDGEVRLGGAAEVVGPEQNIVLTAAGATVGGASGGAATATDWGAVGSSASAWSLAPHAICAADAGWEFVSFATEYNALSWKQAPVNCPSGKLPISGYSHVISLDSGETGALHRSHLKAGAPGAPPVGWFAEAEATGGDWQLRASVVCAPVSDPTVSKNGLLARYRGEDAGHDSYGESVDAGEATTHNSVDYATGPMGISFDFDGVSDQYVEVPSRVLNTTQDLYPEDSFSVDAWIQTASTQPGQTMTIARLYDYGGTNNAAGTNRSYWALYLTEEGYAAVGLRTTHHLGNTPLSVVGDVSLADGEPHHIALVRNNFDNVRRLSLYVDGEFVGDAGYSCCIHTNPLEPGNSQFPDPVLIGAASTANSDARTAHFIGLINDVKYYDRRLTEEEVATIAGCGVPVLPRVLNLDARRYGGPATGGRGLCAKLDAGTYRFTVVSPAEDNDARHTAWSPSASGAWGTLVHAEPEIDPGWSWGHVPSYVNAQVAFDGLASKAVEVTLSAPQVVELSLRDGIDIDNRGGVSVRIEEVVPEPGMTAMLITGVMGLVALRRRSPTCMRSRSPE